MRTKLKSAINQITKNNVFIFNYKYYRQQNGAPMGSSVSGYLAELKLRPLETVIMEHSEIKPSAI